MAPVSEVAEGKHFCPLLIWGWLRKGGMSEGGKRGRRRRRGRSGGTGDLREVYKSTLFLLAERKRKEEGRKEGMRRSKIK